MNADVKSIVEYRLKQARETLAAARALAKNGFLRDAANRAYYTMFYAGVGLLATRMLGASRHSGMIGLFGEHFVKTGAFSRDAGRYLREAFEFRQDADYKLFIEPTDEQVRDMIAHAELFLCEAERVWQNIGE